MKCLDSHAHLLNMVGCISTPENPMLITQLCEMGDLRRILVAHKPHDIFVGAGCLGHHLLELLGGE